MDNIDLQAVEHSIAQATAQVQKAINRNNERAMETYGLALQALLTLRAQLRE